MKQPDDKRIRKGSLTFQCFSEKLVNKHQKHKILKEGQRKKNYIANVIRNTHVVLLNRARMPELTHSFMEE
ncbi:hypothetical protein LA52FAK_17000 [Desulforhopalus sp. 52FAK]